MYDYGNTTCMYWYTKYSTKIILKCAQFKIFSEYTVPKIEGHLRNNKAEWAVIKCKLH